MNQAPGRPPGALNSSVSASPLGQAIHPPEIFIVVRPPPSKQNHPLNLQVQLFIPPVTDGATSASSLRRRSGDFSSGAGGAGVSGSGSLVRSPSLRSTRSGRSGSVGSLGSMGSTVTSSSSRRVTPLYNLGFHAVMATYVTDAGTDAKVSKFLKRGVEVLGLAILDPTSLHAPVTPLSNSTSLPSSLSNSSPSKSTSSPKVHARSASVASATTIGSTGGGSGFLNRFKRMSFKPPAIVLPPSLQNLARPDSNSTLTTANGETIVPLFRTPSNSGQEPKTEGKESSASSLSGRQSSAAGSGIGGSGTQRGYVWTVRKWSRKDLAGSEDGGVEAAGMIRFEWRRGPKLPQGQKGGITSRPTSTYIPSGVSNPSSSPPLSVSPSSAAVSTPMSNRPRSHSSSSSKSPHLDLEVEGEKLTTDPNQLVSPRRAKANSIGARTPEGGRSRSPAGGQALSLDSSLMVQGSAEGSQSTETHSERDDTAEGEDDEEEELDEDSDRPWTCELLHGPSLSRRLYLGTLTPSPHHPKLVARLLVPFSLSPIPLGVMEAGKSVNEGLSVEEMKDCLFTMALWLIVRERMGGVGVRRKGDGTWRVGGGLKG